MEIVDLDMKPTGAFIVAVDVVGSGTARSAHRAGSSARLPKQRKPSGRRGNSGIVDTVETEGQVRYAKSSSERSLEVEDP